MSYLINNVLEISKLSCTRARRKRDQRKRLQMRALVQILRIKRLQISAAFMSILILTNQNATLPRRHRSCRRLPRNSGWWDLVWTSYSDARFKETLRVSRGTFIYILNAIRPDLERESLGENSLTPELRLAICLYRLARGDYYYTIAEMVGVGEGTVCVVVMEVCDALIKRLWASEVSSLFPETVDDFKEAMITMEEHWQFPCCFGAINGCHIPIKCPPGGQQSQKEHHNFKGFYSIVLMAIVDAKFRFTWASCGYTGNNHDSTIFQATSLYKKIAEKQVIPNIAKNINNIDVPPLILGDGAFPFRSWLMKPYSNAALTPDQSYFNYRLSRARMVTEGAYGRLKGRWRSLMRKCDCAKATVRSMTLACIILHNVCIAVGDTVPRSWDINVDPATNKMRPRGVVQDLLQMRCCRAVRDTSRHASDIRKSLQAMFTREKEQTA